MSMGTRITCGANNDIKNATAKAGSCLQKIRPRPPPDLVRHFSEGPRRKVLVISISTSIIPWANQPRKPPSIKGPHNTVAVMGIRGVPQPIDADILSFALP
jgi:hypothetical protein